MEAIEGIVTQLFLLEVRKRCFAPSIIWLHDGFWIDKHVDNEVLFAAEKHVKTLLFPTYDVHSELFHVTDLTEVRNQALANCSPLPCVPFISCPNDIAIADLGTRKYTREFPVAKFSHKRGFFFFFLALCCLGKIPGGAPFSQLHKSGNGSRVDRP